jgi:hypothetical protein
MIYCIKNYKSQQLKNKTIEKKKLFFYKRNKLAVKTKKVLPIS